MVKSVFQILLLSFVIGLAGPAFASFSGSPEVRTAAVKHASAIFFVAAFLDKCSRDPQAQSELDAKADRMRIAIWKITGGDEQEVKAILTDAYMKIRRAQWLIRCNLPQEKIWSAAEESLAILENMSGQDAQ